MNPKLMMLLKRAVYMKPVGEDGGASDAAARGDEYVPTAEELAEEELKNAAGTGKPDLAAEEAAKVGLAAGKKDGAAELTDEEKAAAAAAEEAKGKKDTRIPLARHTEILARERAAREALEVELANTKKGQDLAKTNVEIEKLETKVSELEEKYNKHMAEGETKEATAVMKEIRGTERTIIEAKADFRTQAATATAIEQIRFDTTVERLEAAYPQLKVGDETYDKELVAEILDLSSAYELKGYAPSAALQKAVSIMIKPVTVKQEDATKVTPKVDETEAAKLARETAARKRNTEAANATPPNSAAAGANSDAAGGLLDAKQAIKMPFEKFKAISDDDLSRMRGDTV